MTLDDPTPVPALSAFHVERERLTRKSPRVERGITACRGAKATDSTRTTWNMGYRLGPLPLNPLVMAS